MAAAGAQYAANRKKRPVALTLSPLRAAFERNLSLAYRDRQFCQCLARPVTRKARSASTPAPSFPPGWPQSWFQRKSLSIRSRCSCPRGKSPNATVSLADPGVLRQRKSREDREGPSLMVRFSLMIQFYKSIAFGGKATHGLNDRHSNHANYL
jgi:hypothetical protein